MKKNTYEAEIKFQRPDNATPYIAGDVIGGFNLTTIANAGSAIFELPNIGPAGGPVIVTRLSLDIGLSAVPSGMANFRLHLFNAAPGAILDNAAFTYAATDRTKYLGYLDLATPELLGVTLFTQQDFARDFRLYPGQTSLWANLETRGAYTPAALTEYRFKLKTIEP